MNKNNLNIVFFGTPEFAISALKILLDKKHNVSGVFAGHGQVELVAKKCGIKVFNPTSLKKDENIFEEFKNLKPDICIVAAYGKVIPKKFLDIPQFGFLNIHPSLLPKYRGPSPIQTAILNGEKETGVTIMLVDEEVDHGPILAKKTYRILNSKNNIEMSEDLFELGAKLLVEILPKYINGEIEPVEQDHSKATLTKMFSRDDGHINWGEGTKKTYNKIRALNPEPGTWTTWKDKIINIKKVELHEDKIIIKTIQMEGKKEMPFEDFLRGHSDFDISQFK